MFGSDSAESESPDPSVTEENNAVDNTEEKPPDENDVDENNIVDNTEEAINTEPIPNEFYIKRTLGYGPTRFSVEEKDRHRIVRGKIGKTKKEGLYVKGDPAETFTINVFQPKIGDDNTFVDSVWKREVTCE